MIGRSSTVFVLFGSIAVGCAIFIMAVTNTEHAPAAGIALGLVINSWDYLTILFIIIAVLWLVFVRIILKRYLMDLTSPHENTLQDFNKKYN